MSINNRAVSTSYFKTVSASRISQNLVQSLSIGPPDGHANVVVPVTVVARASPQICSCMVSCVVDDSLKDIDLVLGTDWFAQMHSVLCGLIVDLDNGPVIFSSVITRSHAGVLPCRKRMTPLSSLASSSKSVPSDRSRRLALDIIYDVFGSDLGTGARTSVFSSSVSLTRALELHGVRSEGLSIMAC